jgi:hypothetical protein
MINGMCCVEKQNVSSLSYGPGGKGNSVDIIIQRTIGPGISTIGTNPLQACLA